VITTYLDSLRRHGLNVVKDEDKNKWRLSFCQRYQNMRPVRVHNGDCTAKRHTLGLPQCADAAISLDPAGLTMWLFPKGIDTAAPKRLRRLGVGTFSTWRYGKWKP
jgi:hypothetical protein